MSDLDRWAMHEDRGRPEGDPQKGAYLRIEAMKEAKRIAAAEKCPDFVPEEWE